MKSKPPVCYSEVFKRKVVREIEEGILTISQARTLYDIGGSSTIRHWIDEYSINDRLGKVVHVMTKTEERENLLLKRDLELMKKALEDAQIKLKAYEALVDIAHDKYGIDLKKKSILEPLTQSVSNQQEEYPESALPQRVKPSDTVEKVTTKVRQPLKRK
jgi:transposase-like protein